MKSPNGEKKPSSSNNFIKLLSFGRPGFISDVFYCFLFFFRGLDMPRVFAALMLPHDVCDSLAREAKGFARFDPLARFEPSTNLHITLAYLGDVSSSDAQRLSAAIRPLGSLIPRNVTISRLGTFDRHHLLYASITPAEALDPVAAEVRATIERLGLTYDKKPFKPHLTLARNWRRGYPMATLTTRTVRLGGPILLESVQDPRTRCIRYRQII